MGNWLSQCLSSVLVWPVLSPKVTAHIVKFDSEIHSFQMIYFDSSVKRRAALKAYVSFSVLPTGKSVFVFKKSRYLIVK